jgi:hypothetical protein
MLCGSTNACENKSFMLDFISLIGDSLDKELSELHIDAIDDHQFFTGRQLLMIDILSAHINFLNYVVYSFN